jgi:hypothetical protein
MSIALCDQLSAAQGGGTASAGLGGASQQIANVELGPPKKRFTFTIPASGPGSVAGDQIVIGKFNVFDRIFGARALGPALGAGTTLSIGKIDPNNPANTDPIHYSEALSTVAAYNIEADVNLGEQIGAPPTGAVTDTGDGLVSGAPGGGYGNAPVSIVLTIGGTPTAGAQISGWVDFQTPGVP